MTGVLFLDLVIRTPCAVFTDLIHCKYKVYREATWSSGYNSGFNCRRLWPVGMGVPRGARVSRKSPPLAKAKQFFG